MQNLKRASNELFRRQPDEVFPSFKALWENAVSSKEASKDRWVDPEKLKTDAMDHLLLSVENDVFPMSDWSFSQLCRLAGVAKDTVNKLTAKTASTVFDETLPRSGKPMQVLTSKEVRSIHGMAYTRLWDSDLLHTVSEFATDFTPPQTAFDGRGKGLYRGEQDMFVFLIDPTGWIEIDGEAFAPGFFAWNSEVGRRTVGIETFWFQRACANHIVWNAVDVTTVNRKHTANVHESLSVIRRTIEILVDKRDAGKDQFVNVIRKAMSERIGDTDETTKFLAKQGFTKALQKRALEVARQQGSFTIFSIVDALTRLSQEEPNAGDRAEADQKAGRLLQLV